MDCELISKGLELNEVPTEICILVLISCITNMQDFYNFAHWMIRRPQLRNYNVKKDIVARNNSLYELKRETWDEKLEFNCVQNGELEMVQFLTEHGYDLSSKLRAAAFFGHFDIFKYILSTSVKQGPEQSSEIISFAARGGNMEIVQYCLENGMTFDITDNYTIENIAKYGQDEMVKFLIVKYGFICSIRTMKITIAKGNIPMCKFLMDHGGFLTDIFMKTAVKYGQIEMLQFIMDHEFILTQRLIDFAIEFGQVEMLQFLIGTGLHLQRDSVIIAVECGQVKMLNYLMFGRVFSQDLMRYARHPEMIEYLKTKGLSPTIVDSSDDSSDYD